MRPLDPGLRVAGQAVTAHTFAGDGLAGHKAVQLVKPGQMLVFANGRQRAADVRERSDCSLALQPANVLQYHRAVDQAHQSLVLKLLEELVDGLSRYAEQPREFGL
jgi:hypothetical protein